MNERIVTGFLLIVAIIHLLPLAGLFGVERLNSLYDVQIVGQDIEILMRHRAVLFGIIGALLTYAAFNASIQPLAFVVAFVSISSFLYLAVSVGGFNDAIRRVVIVDIAALVALVIAIGVYGLKR